MREEKLPRFYLGYGYELESGTKVDWDFSEVRGGKYDTEYLSLAEHNEILREARAKVWEEASNATHQYPHYVEFRRFCRSKATKARKE